MLPAASAPSLARTRGKAEAMGERWDWGETEGQSQGETHVGWKTASRRGSCLEEYEDYITRGLLHRTWDLSLGLRIYPVDDHCAPPAPAVCCYHLSTVSSRAFTVAGPPIWNALPKETTSAQSPTIFYQHLKTWLDSHTLTSSSELSSL